MARHQELCPSLRIAKEGEIPELACYRGFSPKKIGQTIIADPLCTEVIKGFTNYSCEKKANKLPRDLRIISEMDGSKNID